MAVPDDQEAPPTHHLPAQEVTHHTIPTSAEPDEAHHPHQKSSIKELAYTFLNNVKSRFGESSIEVTSIWNVCGAFGVGRASKKDTITAVNHALGDHMDLKQDLLNVLYHPQADWQVDDFEFDSPQPNHSATQHVLQAAHQPDMDLPPQPWFEDRHAYTTPNPDYNQTGSSSMSKPAAGDAQYLTVNYPEISAPLHEDCSSRATVQETLASEATPQLSLDVKIPVSIDQLVGDVPPPSKKRRRETLKDQESLETTDQIGLPTTNTAQPLVPSQNQSQNKKTQPQDDGVPRPYIHSICGRGFVARSRVKKHHWGNVLDDLETKTGCWAKHGKPNVSWNEHPSCKETAKAPARARLASPTTKAGDESQAKPQMLPPTAPTMPAVQELHGSIAGTPNMREEYQEPPRGTSLYHSHRIPHRSSFDSLLDAVNMAFQMDTQQPQGRTEFAVPQLDAHATAGERSGQYATDRHNIMGSYGNETVASGYQHPYNTAGSNSLHSLRGYHVPLEVALPFYGRPQTHTPHMYSTATGNWIDDPAPMLNDAHDSRALLLPFSPDPHVGSRTMQDK